jgi:hypothetical protein
MEIPACRRSDVLAADILAEGRRLILEQDPDLSSPGSVQQLTELRREALLSELALREIHPRIESDRSRPSSEVEGAQAATRRQIMSNPADSLARFIIAHAGDDAELTRRLVPGGTVS